MENIDIDMAILENIDIDIVKAILQNIDIDRISNRFKFGISNRARHRKEIFQVFSRLHQISFILYGMS